jgi:hypothetical protein
MRLIIAGSRALSVKALIASAANPGWDAASLDMRLTRFLFRRIEQGIGVLGLTGRVTEVVSGGAIGVDDYGDRWARERGIAVQTFLPQYDRLTDKKRAPLARNEQMAFYASANVQKGALVLIVLDGSTGSAHMQRQAEREGLALWRDDLTAATLWSALARDTRYIGFPHPLVPLR